VELVEIAEQEGVVALVHWRLQQARLGVETGRRAAPDFSLPPAILKAFGDVAHDEALVSMLQEAELRRLLGLMRELGIAGLILKGHALGQWAYAVPHLRACGDIDVLLASRADAERLAHRLEALGHVQSRKPEGSVGYELTCTRTISPAVSIEIDLHWRLSNSPLFGYRFSFEEMMAASKALPGLAPNARGLGAVHALLHACMHRVLNLAECNDSDKLKWLYDLSVLTCIFSESDWQHFQSLCVERGLAGVCLNSLDAAAQTFGAQAVPVPGAVRETLVRAQGAESLDVTRLTQWRYREYKIWTALPTLRLRLLWLWQRLWPSRAYMADIYGRPDLGYTALMGIRLRTALALFMKRKV
jgi:hypothetical protein